MLGRADAVVCVSEPAADDLRRRGIADPVLVRNGADPELLRGGGSGRASRSCWTPTASRSSTRGASEAPGATRAAWSMASAWLAAERPDDAARLELVVAGPLTEAERDLFGRDLAPARIALLGALERGRALALQRAADCLLLIAHPVRSQLANFKLYEYLSAGPPILALAEGTEAGRIAARSARRWCRGRCAAIAGALRARCPA